LRKQLIFGNYFAFHTIKREDEPPPVGYNVTIKKTLAVTKWEGVYEKGISDFNYAGNYNIIFRLHGIQAKSGGK